MRCERSWHGDAVATPVYDWFDQKDAIFHVGSWEEVDNRAHQSDAGPASVEERIGWFEPARDAYPGYPGPTQDHAVSEPAETEQTDLVDRPRWSISITSILAVLWSRILHHREIRCIKAAWETIDDRTLKDIGVSRYDLERARDARRWS